MGLDAVYGGGEDLMTHFDVFEAISKDHNGAYSERGRGWDGCRVVE